MQVHLSFRDMEPSPAVEERVRERAARLERYFDRITACRVVIESPHHHHHKGKLFRVRVDLTVPDGTIIADGGRSVDSSHEDVYVAIRDAFDTARRELEDWVRRRRGEVKHHAAARRSPAAEE
ncbi:MAG TPA: HPF/RaiA family ribosome-associated protein [Candidatus Dormibacteraeota bacterium]|nr:HPF/RaiA family ribosome-associated protein [Candidatus Dormibacteraeota bacterium]